LLIAAVVLAGCVTPGRPEGNPPITAREVWIQLPEGPLSARREVAGGWLDQKFVLVGGWSDRPCPPGAGCVPSEKPAPPEGADEPKPDPQQRLRLAALSAEFTRWTLLPDSDLKDCNLVAVADRVVCPFHTITGKEIPGVPGPHYPYGAILDPFSGGWHMRRPPPASRGFKAGLLNVGDRTFVGGHLVDPRTGKWTTIPTPWWSPQTSRTVLASPDTIFVWGGASDDANLADGYLLRI
jgi:hypothetical protein